ncbi:hypothetical protein [Gallaecimonas xiamenensis]|uniref:Uncharacterized protein n=1 Tax=Gallaecimonas xiamenensis 3-C-1 TaxID=745411 RepID=K2KID9_9GAMM|nr:hypothetical protein [Gallaecimonas xiamenensis]EKE77030.1 hypothetical protein B3C1_02455 [Gallaecimonas xiamenensis 3-C-1]
MLIKEGRPGLPFFYYTLSWLGDGSFRFATSISDGGSYKVTVKTQPNTQSCVVDSASGISHNVTNSDQSLNSSGSLYLY